MNFNLCIDKKKYMQFLSALQSNNKVKLVQSLDMLSIVSIATTKKNMLELMKLHPEIESVEKDGEMFAI
jgi:hypothetical protein